MKINMANIITGIRILCAIALLFCQVISPVFYILYLVAGFTDMIDGVVARKTNTVSEFGSKLDTIADFIFVVICLIKIIPTLDISTWLYVWLVIITLIKVSNVISGFIVQKHFVDVHSVMNKVTGLLMFIFPMTISTVDIKYSAFVVCMIATFAAVQEGHYIRTQRYNNDERAYVI